MRALDHGVYKSDTIIKPALNIALRCSLARLERVSRHDKNHNPENTQNFIVDPCLYPWRFGLTKYYSSPLPRFEDCIRLSGRGISRNLLLPGINGSLNERWSYKIENAWSLVYQCLPCDISFEEKTGKPRYVVLHLLHSKETGDCNETIVSQATSTTCILYATKSSMLSAMSYYLHSSRCSIVP